MNMKRHTAKIIIGLIVVLFAAAYAYSAYEGKKANEGVSIETHVAGNPDAETVLVEYSDFQCPACAQFYPYVTEILEEHGDVLRFEYRHFPLMTIHPHPVSAAKAAEAAGQQGMFFEMHDMLFENQPEWSQSTAPRQYFERYAEELGLDVETFKRHMNASLIEDAIEASFDEARSYDFTGTPSFLLNGEPMEFSTFEEFRSEIEAAIGTTTVISE